MFAAARYVREHCRVDPIANSIAHAIVLFTNRDGLAVVSLRRLAEVTGRHTETVANATKRLERAGVLTVVRRPRQTNVYGFPVEDVKLSTAARSRTAQGDDADDPGLRGFRGSAARSRTAQLGCKQLENPEFSPLEPVPYLTRAERNRLIALGKADTG